jgi:DNA polymerase (family 10)
MEIRDIVDRLQEIATYLELKGENPFKIRAYQSGARALEGLDADLDELIATDELGAVPGIGKALTEKIATLRTSGALPFYDELRHSIPDGLLEMLEIPGFGPKKIRKVNEALGVTTIEELKAACEAGTVAALPGFGKKSVENILRGIENRVAYGKRHIWWDVQAVALPVLEGLRALEAVERAEVAGSFRRGMETVGDLDFIVGSETPAPVMEWFVQLEDVVEVTAQGATKSSVRFQGGLQADLRVVPNDRFVFALHHFTGSKNHNVKMRQRALARGYSLSEWGIFAKDESVSTDARPYDRPLAVTGVREESDLFAALDLAPIVPELREGLDELELAESGELPRLVELSDIKGALHNHTTASDGRGTLRAMAEAAHELGWRWLGIADHSKSSFQANGLSEERLLEQLEAIRQLNAESGAKAHLIAGSEVDILKDGTLDFPKAVTEQLDYVVLSVHSSMSGMTEAAMTDRICKALQADTGCPKVLGHLTGRLLLRREGYAVNVRAVLDVAAEAGVLIELNCNPWRMDMDWRHWRAAVERGIACVINPDAHAEGDLGYMHAGVLAARKAGLSADQVWNCREGIPFR